MLALTLPTHRWAAALVGAALLAALALGARHGPATALLAMSGAAHALLYGALLLVFADTLRPGRIALVTRIAARLNPTFHPGMVPYTRKVTLAWVLLFAAQLLASAAMLAAGLPLWHSFVTILHVVPDILLVVAEAAVRRYRWRHEHATGLLDTIRGTRKLFRNR